VDGAGAGVVGKMLFGIALLEGVPGGAFLAMDLSMQPAPPGHIRPWLLWGRREWVRLTVFFIAVQKMQLPFPHYVHS